MTIFADMGAFGRHLGIQLTYWAHNEATVNLDIRPEFLNRSGILHGGLLTTLIDTAGGYAGTFCAEPGRVRRALTLNLTTQFTGQVSGGIIEAKARRRGGGNKIFFSDIEVFTNEGQSIAFGSGTYRFRTGHDDVRGVAAD